MTVPTTRCRGYCRKRGWDVGSVELTNLHTGMSSDLFGCFDLLVMDEHDGCIGVQATSIGGASERLARLKASELCAKWLRRKLRAEVWAWKKYVVKKRDGTKSKLERWGFRRSVLLLNDGKILAVHEHVIG